MHQPIAQSLIGTGPSSYKDLQTKYKHPLNPEDVASTHNVFIDWVVMLGVGGLAWSMLLLAWMVHAVRSCWIHDSNPSISKSQEKANRTGMTSLTSIDPRWLGYLVLAALPALVTQFFMQAPAMTLERSLLWLLSAGVFIVLAVMLAQDAWYTETGMRLGITTAALALLVHNQIEMTFFQPGSVTIAMVMLGMAGGLPKSAALAKNEVINHKVAVDASSQDSATNIGGGARWVWLAAMVLCLMVVTHHAMQTTQVQSSLRQAAESARRMDLATAQRLLQEAIDTARPAHTPCLGGGNACSDAA
ncbi:MAG: hypothetical protein HC898_02410 [Phycisphaerales bacterium]|nr:hypothetical protein [Phycisphaerales bacterium]